MLFILLKEEPCQCTDFHKFYKEHDRFIRELPTFKKQLELNWASIQSFRTLCSKVTEELHNQLSDKDIKNKSVENNQHISDIKIKDEIEKLQNVNTFPYYIEALIETILDIKKLLKM